MKFMVFLLLLFPIIANAGLSEGIKSFENKEYANALREFEALAKEGEVESMYYLGIMHERGLGVIKNEDTAYEYFAKAAEGGDGKSAFKIGNAYSTGVGRPHNLKNAYKWFNKAIELNNDEGQYMGGKLYLENENYEKAKQLFMLSAMQGNNNAQFELGNIYFEGNGVPQDYSQAILWYNLAANQGNVTSQGKLADLYSTETVRGVVLNSAMAYYWYNLISGSNIGTAKEDATERKNEISLKMKPETIREAQKKSTEWRKKTKEESIPNIKEGRIYMDSELKNEDLALVAAMKNESTKQKTEAERNELEEGVDVQALRLGINSELVKNALKERDLLPVFNIARQMAETGNNVQAMNLLGDLYSQNIPGVPRDYNQAIRWYNLSAQNGSYIGQFKLGTMLCEGKGVDANLVECYKWFLIVEDRASNNAKKYIKSMISKVTNALDEQESAQAIALANKYKVEVLNSSPIRVDNEKFTLSDKGQEEVSSRLNEKEKVEDNMIIKGVDAPILPKKNEEKKGGYNIFK